MAAANMPRLALAGMLGMIFGSLAGTESRWLGTLAVTAGVGSTLVSSAFVAAVMLRAHSLGLPFSAPSLEPGASERRWLAPEAVTLASSDSGWRIEADLYRPAADGGLLKRDAIVVVHGGAWRHGDKGESPWSNQWLVERGYVVLDIQYSLAPVADLRALLGAGPGTGERTYRDASPLEQVSAYVPPTLLIHGTWDDLVPLAHSRRLAATLAANGAHVRLVEVPFARHAFDLVPDGLQTLFAHEAIAAFLEDRLADPG